MIKPLISILEIFDIPDIIKNKIKKQEKQKVEVGKKYDEDKPRWHLLPIDEMTEVVRVLTFGAKKYGDDNWKHVRPKERYLDATYRHLTCFIKGDKYDSESKMHHLAHAISNLLFLMWHDKQGGN